VSLSSFSSFLPSFFKNNKGKEDAEKAARLKEELLAAIAPLDRGAEATQEDKDRVEQIARQLEEASNLIDSRQRHVGRRRDGPRSATPPCLPGAPGIL
jgi:hypothetical protein